MLEFALGPAVTLAAGTPETKTAVTDVSPTPAADTPPPTPVLPLRDVVVYRTW